MSIVAIITDKLPDEGSRQFYFGEESGISGRHETIVRVWPKSGEPWFGIFPAGAPGSNPVETTGIHVWPSTNRLFVVSKGRGYFVDGNDPDTWDEAHLSQITSFVTSSVNGTLVVCDQLRVAAYSAHGLLWKSAQISWNGIRELRITKEGVTGEAWDDLWSCWVAFLIDARTGKHQGGATFSFE